jgi:hypothetical protein
MTKMTTTVTVLARATRTMEGKALVVTLGQKQSGVDAVTNPRLRRIISSMEYATSIPTSTKMAGKSHLISSSSVMSSYD